MKGLGLLIILQNLAVGRKSFRKWFQWGFGWQAFINRVRESMHKCIMERQVAKFNKCGLKQQVANQKMVAVAGMAGTCITIPVAVQTIHHPTWTHLTPQQQHQQQQQQHQLTSIDITIHTSPWSNQSQMGDDFIQQTTHQNTDFTLG